MKKILVIITFLISSSVPLISGCGSTETSSTADSSIPPDVIGTYSTENGGYPVGLELRDDGTYSDFDGTTGSIVIAGTYSVQDNVVTITSENNNSYSQPTFTIKADGIVGERGRFWLKKIDPDSTNAKTLNAADVVGTYVSTSTAVGRAQQPMAVIGEIMELKADGTYHAEAEVPFRNGEYRISGREITFIPTSIVGTTPGDSGMVWKYMDDGLVDSDWVYWGRQ